ncbi:MAG: hypothetical protein GVY29_03880 [Spirochaetes bacterium]|nr:hypothetical protein [Spirochaetota bacterium]
MVVSLMRRVFGMSQRPRKSGEPRSLPKRFVVSVVAASVTAAVLTTTACVGREPAERDEMTSLIIDTDLRADCDDAGALAVAHALADRGQTELIGVIASTTGPHVVGAIDAINHFYGKPDIPIALTETSNRVGSDDFAPTLADTSRFPSDETNRTAPEATILYRRLLWEAEEPITIVVIGFQTALAAFLESGPDHRGDGITLSGKELAQGKVEELVLMAGHFTDPTHNEWNVQHDIAAAQNIARNWPGRIVYSGFEIGVTIMTGEGLRSPEQNPVTMAYKRYAGTEGGAGTVGDRHSWDQTAVLYAAAGTSYRGNRLWRLSESGTVGFARRVPYTHFVEYPDGSRHHLIQEMASSRLADLIETLMVAE